MAPELTAAEMLEAHALFDCIRETITQHSPECPSPYRRNADIIAISELTRAMEEVDFAQTAWQSAGGNSPLTEADSISARHERLQHHLIAEINNSRLGYSSWLSRPVDYSMDPSADTALGEDTAYDLELDIMD